MKQFYMEYNYNLTTIFIYTYTYTNVILYVSFIMKNYN